VQLVVYFESEEFVEKLNVSDAGEVLYFFLTMFAYFPTDALGIWIPIQEIILNILLTRTPKPSLKDTMKLMLYLIYQQAIKRDEIFEFIKKLILNSDGESIFFMLLDLDKSFVIMLAESFKTELKEALASLSRFEVEQDLSLNINFKNAPQITQDIIRDLVADKLKEHYFFE
jgi:hypothetical protein